MNRLVWYILMNILLVNYLKAQEQIIDKIAAVVDDEVILLSEVQNYAYFEAMNQKIDPTKDPDAYKAIEKNVLDALINQKIMLAQAMMDSIVIENSQVEQALEQQLKERIQQAGGEQALEKYLGKSLKDIRKMYRENVRKQLLAQKIQQTRFQNIKVSRSEIEHYYRQRKDSLPEVGASINFSHILLEIKPGAEAFEEAGKTAALILDSLKNGADFAAMAKRYSTDPGSGKKGGDLGWFNRSDFVKEFADAASRLEPGEMSGLVKTQFGWHIIQMIEKAGEKIHVRHILIGVATTEQDKKNTRKKLAAIRQDILDNKISFENAVMQYSDDDTKKGNLGNLGWIEIQSLNERGKPFLKAAETLKKDEISEPFEGDFGYHIIRLNDRRDRRTLDLKEDWQTIEQMALQEKQYQEMNKWLKQIRNRFYIDIRM